MPNNSDIYKSFTVKPCAAYEYPKGKKLRDLSLLSTGDLIPTDLEDVKRKISKDVTTVTDLTEWFLGHGESYLEDVKNSEINQNNELGRLLGISIPSEIAEVSFTGTSGRSRYDKLLQDRCVREFRSWLSRKEVADEKLHKICEETPSQRTHYISSGWKRTADATRPCDIVPKVCLSAVDPQFAKIINDPLRDEFIRLFLIADGFKYILDFKFDVERFNGGYKVCLPDIVLNERGIPQFNFSIAYSYTFTEFSSRYIVGVDLGIKLAATAVVWDTKIEQMVHVYTMSRRARSLQNSIKATARQVTCLQIQGRREEAALHRAANCRKKRELAILVAQEIADIASVFDNAVVAIEDLSWISNTMQNGRWNRGELVDWLQHYVEVNGGRMVKVNCAGTSQRCHVCQETVQHKVWSDSYCPQCDAVWDRDINASVNVALVCVEKSTWAKMIKTRLKAKRVTSQVKRRSPIPRNTLKYPGRDRTKNKPTPSRVKKTKFREIILPNKEKCSSDCIDDSRVTEDDHSHRMVRTLKKQHDISFTELLL